MESFTKRKDTSKKLLTSKYALECHPGDTGVLWFRAFATESMFYVLKNKFHSELLLGCCCCDCRLSVYIALVLRFHCWIPRHL